ncbi:MAG: outer membrane lipoprotein LolB [Gammaproteobacteria bacterium]|nr:outer membrane lipoprotein LolB [Gammaproteobacteria bacterium]
MKKVLLCLIALVASGCASLPEPPPVAHPDRVWQQRRDVLTRIAVWHLSGRLAVRNGPEAWHINLDWQQKGDDYQITLNGPFGAGKVKLIGNATGVALHDSDNQTFYADNPATLLQERTGVIMPIEGLRYWIVGLDSPQQTTPPKLDPQGRLAALDDNHWQVSFRRYTEVSGLQLPEKIFIARPEQEIDVRLVVDEWKLGAN